jgi:phage terminase large subunit-like protein
MGEQAEVRLGQATSVFDDMMFPSRYKALYGGRASAKSHFFAESMVANAADAKGFRGLCIREVQKSLKESAKRLIEDKIISMGVGSLFNVKHDEIGTPGGGVISFTGMNQQNSESVKSYENYVVCWVEEASSFSSKSLELIRPTIRSPNSELWFSWNPDNAADPVDKFFRGLNPPDDAIIRKVTYQDNKYLPAEMLAEMELDRKNNPDRFAHIWLGEYAPQAVGAIWNMANIHENRRNEAPTLKRILVAVDPAISNTDQSDEHGIVCGGIGEDGRGYIIDDVSLHGSPQQWAERAVATYDRYDADAIVVERNQGGDMVRHTLKTVRPNIKVVEVVATRGKHVRAEPISAMYATNQISHVGSFPELEAQMCRMTTAGYDGEGSPDRCDALVWLMTELFPSIIRKTKRKSVRPASKGWMG